MVLGKKVFGLNELFQLFNTVPDTEKMPNKFYSKDFLRNSGYETIILYEYIL